MFVLCAVECVLKKERRKRNRKGLRKSQIRAHPLEQTLHKNVLTPTSVRDASRQLTSPDLLQLFFLPLPSSQSFTAFEVKSHNNKKTSPCTREICDGVRTTAHQSEYVCAKNECTVHN